MSIFGDFYKNPIKFRRSKKETMVSHSEDWSAAILSGSSELVAREDPVRRYNYYLLAAVLIVVFLMLFVQLFNLQVVEGRRNSLLAKDNRIRTVVIPAPRGAIYDRNGVLLARNVAQNDLVAVPKQLPEDDAELATVGRVVAQITAQDEVAIIAQLRDIRKSNQPEEVLLAKLEREQALNIEERRAELTGLSLETTPQREYLDQAMLAHFLGYIGRISAEEWKERPEYRSVDTIGKSGIEKSYEADLRGTAGKEQVEIDSTGRPIRFLARVEPNTGKDLILTIDWELQKQVYNNLKAQVERAGSKAGSAVVLDPNTGEVLAAVNYPSYDANLFAKGIGQADYSSLLNNDAKPLLNRVTSGNYPIGSVVKAFISTAALEEKVVNINTSVEDRGKLEVQNVYDPNIIYTFKGWKPEGLGIVNVVRAMQWSSDIFYYQVGGGYKGFQGLGEKRLLDWYGRFGFGKSTGLDIDEESAGYLPSPEKKKKATGEPWYVGDTYNVAIGQGDLRATPLQVAVANAAIANGGKIIKPKLIRELKFEKSLLRASPPEILNPKIASADNIRIVQRGMEEAVSGGTACCSIKSKVPVQVAGKTGTAETSSEGFDGKNPRTKPHAWFNAYAPAQSPRIAMVVMVENSGEGAEFALPVSREAFDWYFRNR